MKNNSAVKRTANIICVIIAILITALLMDGLIFVLWMKLLRPKKALAEGPMHSPRIEREYKGTVLRIPESFEYEGIIAYMFDSNASADVFEEAYGADALTIDAYNGSVRILKDSLMEVTELIDEDDFPKHIVIGLDPYAIFLQSASSWELFDENITFVTELAKEHEGCFFTINLPEDHADKWNSLTSVKLDDARRSYSELVKKYAECTNIAVYYYSLEEWVLYSKCIRDDLGNGPLRTDISNRLLTRDFADLHLIYLMTENTVDELMEEVVERSGEYQDTLDSYSDLSDKKVMFIGDSVFGNYRDETSVSTYFAEMTGAKTYNLSHGGISAAAMVNSDTLMGKAFDYLTGDIDTQTFDSNCSSYDCYNSFRLAGADIRGTTGEDAIFVIEFGLNDYFGGVDPNEFRNAIYTMGTRLKAAYPDSTVLFLSPGHVGLYTFGTEILPPAGAPLQVYREISREAALEAGCNVLSLANDFDFKFEELYFYLLRDTVHYNESGRYLIAQHLARYF